MDPGTVLSGRFSFVALKHSSFLPVPASAEVLLGSFTFLLAVCTRVLKELSLCTDSSMPRDAV